MALLQSTLAQITKLINYEGELSSLPAFIDKAMTEFYDTKQNLQSKLNSLTNVNQELLALNQKYLS